MGYQLVVFFPKKITNGDSRLRVFTFLLLWLVPLSFIGDTMPFMEHTRMRFDTMTERKLWNRLGATSNPDKLRCFVRVAREYGHNALATAAQAKYDELYGVASLRPRRAVRRYGSVTESPTPSNSSHAGPLISRRPKARTKKAITPEKKVEPKKGEKPVRLIRI